MLFDSEHAKFGCGHLGPKIADNNYSIRLK